MQSFEGIFRTKPSQNYSGSNVENSSSLVQRNREERKKREQNRLQNEAATCLQSFVRGSLTRMARKRYTRDQFDEILSSQLPNHRSPPGDNVTQSQKDAFTSLLRCFNNFFDPKLDKDRLMACCNLSVSTNLKQVFDSWMEDSSSGDCIYILGRFLVNIIQYLESLEKNASSSLFAMPLRALETIVLNTRPATAENMALIVFFVTKKGYFRSLAGFIDRQTMEPDLVNYNHARHTQHQKVSSLVNIFMAPFLFNRGQIKANDLRQLVVVCLNSIYTPDPFFNYSVTSKVLKVISGALASTLPLSILVTSLIQPESNITFCLTVRPSLGLLHLLAYWLLPLTTVDSLDSAEACALVTSLALLLSYLPITSPASVRPMHLAMEEDSDNEMEVEDSDRNNLEAGEILHVLRDKGCDLLRLALSGTFVSEITVYVCNFYYHITSDYKLSTSVVSSYTSVLAQSSPLLRHLWTLVESLRPHDTSSTSSHPLLALLSTATLPTEQDLTRFLPLVSTFAAALNHRLLGLHDAELQKRQWDDVASLPCPSESAGFRGAELGHISARLRDLMHGLIELAHPDSMKELEGDYRGVLERMQKGAGVERTFRHSLLNSAEQRQQLNVWSAVFHKVQRLVVQLYSRDRRLHFCSEQHWLKASVADSIHLDTHSWLRRNSTSPLLSRVPFGYYSLLNPDRDTDETTPIILSTREARQLTFLVEMPFVVPFEKRVKIFQSLVVNSRLNAQGASNNPHLDDYVHIKVRRSHLYEDSFDKLSKENETTLHPRFRIEFLNLAGAMEAGIDGGGLSREFISELLRVGFDPTRGLFIYSEDNTLYPNPQAEALADNYLTHYFFLGRMLAKAIYEGMLVELTFAQFFLAKVLSRTGGEVDIDYLQSLDKELYKNLLYVKRYEGDWRDLELDFSTMRNVFGKSEVIDLKPDGRNIPVTKENRVEYIHLMAHYKLNRQIRPHVKAFLDGLNDVVPIDWLRLFDAGELQMLISGADMAIDVDDLKGHTVYLTDTKFDSETINQFWVVVASMSEKEKQSLLRFVTSCSRPPMFGFRELYPPFAIQLTPDLDRLPSSSTCMNLLKLPDFKDPTVIRDKLLYAINSGAGFELS